MSAMDEIRSIIGYAQGTHGGPVELRALLTAGAQVEAIFLLAEEQRTANLLALAALAQAPADPAVVRFSLEAPAFVELMSRISTRLGLDS